MNGDMVSIYVLPTEEGKPPRALIGQVVEADGLGEVMVGSNVATWSRDSGTWMMGAEPVPTELGDAITDHAKSLGVEW